MVTPKTAKRLKKLSKLLFVNPEITLKSKLPRLTSPAAINRQAVLKLAKRTINTEQQSPREERKPLN
jgi:hypothetical protein